MALKLLSLLIALWPCASAEEILVPRGRSVSIFCEPLYATAADQSALAAWFKANRFLGWSSRERNVVFDPSGDGAAQAGDHDDIPDIGFLVVDNAQIGVSNGTYHCEVNGVRSAGTTVIVSFMADEFVARPPSVVRATVGYDEVVRCEPPNAVPAAHIAWMKDGSLLRMSDTRYTIAPRSLTVHNVTPEAAGQYACVATNLAGAKRADFLLLDEREHADAPAPIGLSSIYSEPDADGELAAESTVADHGGVPLSTVLVWFAGGVLVGAVLIAAHLTLVLVCCGKRRQAPVANASAAAVAGRAANGRCDRVTPARGHGMTTNRPYASLVPVIV